MHGHERAQTRIAVLDLLVRQAVLDRRLARAAVAVEMHAQDAELPEAARQLGRELAPFEPAFDVRQDVFGHEQPHALTRGPLVLGEQPVDL